MHSMDGSTARSATAPVVRTFPDRDALIRLARHGPRRAARRVNRRPPLPRPRHPRQTHRNLSPTPQRSPRRCPGGEVCMGLGLVVGLLQGRAPRLTGAVGASGSNLRGVFWPVLSVPGRLPPPSTKSVSESTAATNCGAICAASPRLVLRKAASSRCTSARSPGLGSGGACWTAKACQGRDESDCDAIDHHTGRGVWTRVHM